MNILRRIYYFIDITTQKDAFLGRDEESNPLIFGQPDSLLFSLDPDPTCNNGFIKYSKFKIKMMVYKIYSKMLDPKVIIRVLEL